ncbi:MAG: ABC transporter permease [Bacteroidales bacterium]|nr:ABC transporter permease [Bacteroidales bacterium]
MDIFRIGLAKLFSKPASTVLSILLFAIGVSIISLLINLQQSLKGQFNRNLAGIDLVAGAKGSPLQLILSTVFHVDVPTGNIPLSEANRISKNPMIEKTIPIALGDSYKGFRIVGTTGDYPALYQAELLEGNWFEKSAEVIIGWEAARKCGLKTGDRFSGVHGFMEHGHSHDYFEYQVVGTLKRSNTVIDKLILTPVESVWEVHGGKTYGHDDEESVPDPHDHAECDHDDEEHTIPEANPVLEEIMAKIEADEELSREEMLIFSEYKNLLAERDDHPSEEITALLVFFNSPVANVTLPRLINETTNLQAAVPAFEINRLLGLLGIGIETLRLLAWVIIFISGMNIFIHLLNILGKNSYEIALIRVFGTPRYKVFLMLLSQGFFLSVSGWIAGLFLSRFVWMLLPSFGGFSVEHIPVVTANESLLLVYTIFVGISAAIIPAVIAYKTNIHNTLSKS